MTEDQTPVLLTNLQQPQSVGLNAQIVVQNPEDRKMEAESEESPFAPKEKKDGIPLTEKKPWVPHCMHSRFARIDRTKFKDRIEWLKECRRCGHMRVFVVGRDFNTRNAYVKTMWYDVPKAKRENVPE